MIPCQRCTADNPTVCNTPKDYTEHLKSFHLMGRFGEFKCFYASCDETFHLLRRFRDHITKHFDKNDEISGFDPPQNQPVVILENEVNQMELNIEEPLIEGPINEPMIEDEIEDFDINETILKSVLNLVLELHSKANFARSDVFKIQTLITQRILNTLLTILSTIENCACETKHILSRALNTFIKSLDLVKNDYGLIKTITKQNLGVDLESEEYEFTISKELGVIFKNGSSFFGDIINTGMLLPIRFQVKEFLSRHNRLSEMISSINRLSVPSDTIHHILQGTSWTKIRSHFDEQQIVIPIGLYTDGMQFNNPLGPHSDSADMLYYYFPALIDPFHKDNIHVAAIIRSKHIQNYGSGRCLASLVRELFRLYYDGVDIVVDGTITNVKIVLCQIIGDNAALNATLEYIMNFRGNFYCRICRLSKQDAEKLCEEIIDELRNKENYERDLQMNPSLTAIAEDCVFNILPYFHCTLNYSLDLMHDFFEGIFRYDICQAIVYFLNKKYFTLEQLNSRISNFNYGSEDVRYIPNILTRDNLTANNLKMTAREAWQFLYLLPILIGDKIPVNDEVWELLRTLLQIIEMCLGSSFNQTKLDILASLIRRHHTIYQKHFGALKPKMHLITHLPSSIKAMGPPRCYMCFRMEYKHQFFKVYAHVTRNRKNIAKSFAKKYVLHFAHLLLRNEPYLEIETGKVSRSNYPNLTNGYECYKSLNYRGTDYLEGMFLPLLENGVYNLYKIMEIAVLADKLSIVGKKIGKLTYEQHFESFALERETQENLECKLIPLENFNSVPLYIYKKFTEPSRTELIRPKIFFQQI